MNKLLYHIIPLLLLPVLCIGQGSKSIVLNPDSPIPFQDHTYVVRVKINNPEEEVFFADRTLTVKDGKINNSILKLNFSLESADHGDAGFYFDVKPGLGLALAGKGSHLKLDDQLTQVNFILSFGSSESRTNITLAILDSDGNSVKSLSLPILLKVSGTIPAPNPCLSIAIKENRLNCLNNLDTKDGNGRDEIELLKTERDKIRSVLENGFKITTKQENSFEITCQDCDISKFKLDLDNNQRNASLLANKKGWSVQKITRNTNATVTSPDWPSLKGRPFYLTFKPLKSQIDKEGDNTEKNEPTGETIEEVVPVPVTQEEGNPSIIIADSLSPTPETTLAEAFWQDSIMPVLNIKNIVSRNDTLSARLTLYQEKGTSSGRKALAWILLHPWILFSLLLLFLPLLRFGKKKNQVAFATTDLPSEGVEPALDPGLNDVPEKVDEPERQGVAELPTELTEEIIQTETVYHPVEIREPEVFELDGIQIKEVENPENGGPGMTLMEMDASPDFISLDLRACWQDTALGLVYFNKESIRAIGEKLQLENAFDQRRNNVDELSEIGGFLLGYFYPDGDKDYHVSINTFIPITPEKNDRYTVKFGDRAWSELDDAYKKHPGQRLVGWFHTHPGHGLFLSNADVKVHKDSFKERYQFAMEIDPTTPGSEIAFFSWKKNGKLNNQDDRLLTDWWSFQELEFQSKNT